MVTVVMNQSESEIKYKLYVGTSSAVEVVIPAHAIQTLVY
jgi:glucosylceramidase